MAIILQSKRQFEREQHKVHHFACVSDRDMNMTVNDQLPVAGLMSLFVLLILLLTCSFRFTTQRWANAVTSSDTLFSTACATTAVMLVSAMLSSNGDEQPSLMHC